MILIIIITLTILTTMFYQVHTQNYTPQRPNKKERYIENINKLLKQQNYPKIKNFLKQPKYNKDELPWNYWKKEIHTEIIRIQQESKKIESLKGLEDILNG